MTDTKKKFKNLTDYIDYLIKWIKQEVKRANANGVILGLSGGVDSALVAALAVKACSNNALSISMNISNSKLDSQCIKLVKKNTNIKLINLNLKHPFKELVSCLKQKDNQINNQQVLGNIKARLRMITLYAFAQINHYLVLGTGNADEFYSGYFTKYGDGGCDLMPIVNLTKQEVKTAAAILGIDPIVCNRAPTASLWPNQTDESELGFSYDNFDAFLFNKKVDKKIKEKIDSLHKQSAHKRAVPNKPLGFSKIKI